MNLVISFATDNGQTFVNRHCGDAEKFYIYNLNGIESKYLKSIDNIADKNHNHGEENKAKNIGKILKSENVNILVSKKFGSNINKIKKQFLPVIVDVETIDEGIKLVNNNFNLVLTEYNKGEDREPLELK